MSAKKFTLMIAASCLGLALLAGGCSPAGNVVSVGMSHNGSVVQLNAGDTLEVALESNPTTGYSWQIVEIDPALLSQEGEVEFEPQSDLVGAGGIETFRFKALAPGEGTLQLNYHRIWEEGVNPLEVFSITVSVK
jgi:inhibitor of cysteine peptidase